MNEFDLPIYPKKVQKVLRSIIPVIKDMVLDDAYENCIEPLNTNDIVYEAAITSIIGQKVFDNYINNGDCITIWTNEKIAVNDLQLIFSCVHLYTLKQKGIIDSMRDENDEEFFFIKNKE